jgi:hypothetical protein
MPLPGEVLDQLLGMIALDLDSAVAHCAARTHELLEVFECDLGVTGQTRDQRDPTVAAAATTPLDAHDAVARMSLCGTRPWCRATALTLASAAQIAIFGRVHPRHAVIMQR